MSKEQEALNFLEQNAGDPRAQVLLEAARCILNDRQKVYGAPEDNFKNIADAWNFYQDLIKHRKLESHDVAIMMMLMKICRLAETPGHKDSWVDSAGYSGCGYSCVAPKVEVRTKELRVQYECNVCNKIFVEEQEATNHFHLNGGIIGGHSWTRYAY